MITNSNLNGTKNKAQSGIGLPYGSINQLALVKAVFEALFANHTNKNFNPFFLAQHVTTDMQEIKFDVFR